MFMLTQPYLNELSLQLKFARKMVCTHDFSFHSSLKSPHNVCWLIIEGERTIEINQTEYTVSAGNLVFFPPSSTFGLLPSTNTDDRIHYLSLGFKAQVGTFHLSELYKFPLIDYLPKGDKQTDLIDSWLLLIEHFTTIAKQIENNTESLLDPVPSIHFLQIQSLLYQWLVKMMSSVLSTRSEQSFLIDRRVMTVCDYIKQNLNRTIELNQLAQLAFVSPSHLNHLFKQSVGLSPMEYVRQLRIDRAKELLLGTFLPINEIAEKVGYTEPSQFSRFFRSVEGISPLRYRKQADYY